MPHTKEILLLLFGKAHRAEKTLLQLELTYSEGRTGKHAHRCGNTTKKLLRNPTRCREFKRYMKLGLGPLWGDYKLKDTARRNGRMEGTPTNRPMTAAHNKWTQAKAPVISWTEMKIEKCTEEDWDMETMSKYKNEKRERGQTRAHTKKLSRGASQPTRLPYILYTSVGRESRRLR